MKLVLILLLAAFILGANCQRRDGEDNLYNPKKSNSTATNTTTTNNSTSTNSTNVPVVPSTNSSSSSVQPTRPQGNNFIDSFIDTVIKDIKKGKQNNSTNSTGSTIFNNTNTQINNNNNNTVINTNNTHNNSNTTVNNNNNTIVTNNTNINNNNTVVNNTNINNNNTVINSTITNINNTVVNNTISNNNTTTTTNTTMIGITNTTNTNNNTTNNWNQIVKCNATQNSNITGDNSKKTKKRTNGTDAQFDTLDEWNNTHENEDDQDDYDDDNEDDGYFTYYNISDNSTEIKNITKKYRSSDNPLEDCYGFNSTEANRNNMTKRNESNDAMWNRKDNTTATNSSIITEQTNQTAKFSAFQLKASFEQWKSIHKKIYASPFEETFRRAIYFDNYQLIALHNANMSNTYNLSLNAFADLQEEEFLHKYLTPKTFQQQIHDIHSQDDQDVAFQNEDDIVFDIVLPQNTTYQLANSSGLLNNYTTNNITSQKFNLLFPNLPEEFNWKDKGAVTPVRNQGGCGSSWAFSAAGLIEGVNFLRTKELTSLSEQQLLDCCGKKGHNCEGCQGGWPEQAISYVKDYGILKQSQYPYTGLEGACAVDVPTDGVFIQSQKYVESNTRSLKQAVVTQPVSVAVDASKWHLYSSGVFNNCKSLKSAANHAGLLVGYTSEGHWIVKNSWGTNWGQNGYITLQSGNTCGIQNFALIAKI